MLQTLPRIKSQHSPSSTKQQGFVSITGSHLRNYLTFNTPVLEKVSFSKGKQLDWILLNVENNTITITNIQEEMCIFVFCFEQLKCLGMSGRNTEVNAINPLLSWRVIGNYEPIDLLLLCILFHCNLILFVFFFFSSPFFQFCFNGMLSYLTVTLW